MTSSDDLVETAQADVLSSEEIASAYQRWEAPRMVSVSDLEDDDHSMMTVQAIEKLQKEAQEEGFKTGFEQGTEAGYQAGLETGKQEISQQLTVLNQIITALNTPLLDLDQQVENDLMNIVITMTRQLVRRELRAEPEHVIGAMRAALAVLPINDRKLKIYLHPQDIELVKKGLSVEQGDENWQWVEDPVLTRGGLRLETADTTVDATVEARLASVINKLLGEERSDDSSE
ncbi:MAG: flagellar assembly protein FliH [Gammaproteobacteria bacterium]|nr:MAG: flagellar assembly protein FliH [Gammaproteobacteria bacterium]